MLFINDSISLLTYENKIRMILSNYETKIFIFNNFTNFTNFT